MLHRNRPASSRRALLRDLADGLMQQMFFWGCDARHPHGSLLLRVGMKRLAREEEGGEGSSRYRKNWMGGVVDLHSFCAGWYPDAGTGVIFLRSSSRMAACSAGEALTPGQYETGRFLAASGDDLLPLTRPLVAWILDYENSVATLAGSAYRDRCWMRLRAQAGKQAWLPPVQARDWLKGFLADPDTTPRARKFSHPNLPPASCKSPKHAEADQPAVRRIAEPALNLCLMAADAEKFNHS